MPADSRAHPRRVVNWRVQWSADGSAGSGRACDVGAGGMFLQCASGLQQGTRVVLEFRVPNRPGCDRVGATVRWSGFKSSYGCSGWGLQFDDASPAIDQFVGRAA